MYYGVLQRTARYNPARHTVALDINGNYPYKMDPKFRVSVPAPWRPLLGENFQLLKADRMDEPMIIVLTEDDYRDRLRLLQEDDQIEEGMKRMIRGDFHARCRPAVMNDQGKLLVPKEWAEYASIEAGGSVLLEGRGKHFEIWNPESYETAKKRVEEKTKAVVDRLGIFS